MPSKVIMVQGTTSHAGKSVFATALCRIFAQDGYSVAPFKAQNMALNSYVTPDGGEIGRSQAVQAQAAGVEPTVEMNPILLKPEGERRSQVVVMGKVTEAQSAREYYKMKPKLWPIVTNALDTLRDQYDVVVIEGAGSPAEINLKAHEIVNMRVARYADSPVMLVADIDRGGVFASLVGTMVLLDPEEQALIKAFVINKFRGDPSLLDSGLDMLFERTGVPVAGVITYFKDIHIPEEDSLGITNTQKTEGAEFLNVGGEQIGHVDNGRLVLAPGLDGEGLDDRLERGGLDRVLDAVVAAGADAVLDVAQQHLLVAQLPAHDAVARPGAAVAEARLRLFDLSDPQQLVAQRVERNLIENLVVEAVDQEEPLLSRGLVGDHFVVGLDLVLLLLVLLVLGFVLRTVTASAAAAASLSIGRRRCKKERGQANKTQ